jgi:hypothetical protein
MKTGKTDTKAMTEVVLQDGEKLLGVISKRYASSGVETLAHCNLVLILGRLE